MNNIIYWHKFDEPKKYKNEKNGKIYEGEIHGEYRSTDDRVDKVWYTGHCSQIEKTNEFKHSISVNFLFKDGRRFEFELIDTPPYNWDEDSNNLQASNFLKSIE